MTLTPEQISELEQARGTMRTYARDLPEGSEERAEFEQAAAEADETLRSYARTEVSEPTDATAPKQEQDGDGDNPKDPEVEADEGQEDPDLDPETEQALDELARQLKEEGYDVGDAGQMVQGAARHNYSRQVIVDPDVAQMHREDIDERVKSLVEGEKLLPYEGDQLKVALYALMDATPEQATTGGLRVYSREEGGMTPAAERRAAVRDILTVLGGRENVGLTRTYTRDPGQGQDNAGAAPLSLTLPDDVTVNEQSAHLANSINALAQERGISFAEATKLYEREKGKVTLKKY